MKIFKLFYIFNLLLIITYLIIPSLCNNNGKPIYENILNNRSLEKLDDLKEKKKKKNKIILYSLLGTALALATGIALGIGGNFLKKKINQRREEKNFEDNDATKKIMENIINNYSKKYKSHVRKYTYNNRSCDVIIKDVNNHIKQNYPFLSEDDIIYIHRTMADKLSDVNFIYGTDR